MPNWTNNWCIYHTFNIVSDIARQKNYKPCQINVVSSNTKIKILVVWTLFQTTTKIIDLAIWKLFKAPKKKRFTLLVWIISHHAYCLNIIQKGWTIYFCIQLSLATIHVQRQLMGMATYYLYLDRLCPNAPTSFHH